MDEIRLAVYDSSKRPSPFLEELLGLLRSRDLVVQLIARSVKTRYKRSVLGVAWTMVNPLLTMLVLTLVFSTIFRFPTRQYALYVLSGLILWSFFSQSTTAAIGDLLWSGNLIGRVVLPKTVFAIAAVGTGLVNLVLALAAYSVIALALGSPPGPSALLLPLPMLSAAFFAAGIGLLLSGAAVYFADVLPTYEVLLTAWMYLTPVIYPFEVMPASVQAVLRLNPMFYLVTAFRSVLYEGRVPDPATLAIGFGCGLGMLILGWWSFTRRSREYVYRV
jgi:ABC-type polysaccharide/polyol phosphate export permease